MNGSASMTLRASDRPLNELHDAMILDLDGVVYVGPHAVRAAPEAISKTRAAGARARAKLVEGGAAERILSVGRRWRPDVIVIGTHGRSGVRHWLMGSVAEHVVRRASRPVLTVRGR